MSVQVKFVASRRKKVAVTIRRAKWQEFLTY